MEKPYITEDDRKMALKVLRGGVHALQKVAQQYRDHKEQHDKLCDVIAALNKSLDFFAGKIEW